MDAAWPVDELVKLYLSDAAPERFSLDPADIYLEIRGARGAFQINRLPPGAYAFRAALPTGRAARRRARGGRSPATRHSTPAPPSASFSARDW